MSYTQEAKDLYEAFQNAMGNWERIPFERIATRELAAWQAATGVIVSLKDELDAADAAVRDSLDEVESLREELGEAKADLSQSKQADQTHGQIGMQFNVGECK
jgi:hypothetical protein